MSKATLTYGGVRIDCNSLGGVGTSSPVPFMDGGWNVICPVQYKLHVHGHTALPADLDLTNAVQVRAALDALNGTLLHPRQALEYVQAPHGLRSFNVSLPAGFDVRPLCVHVQHVAGTRSALVDFAAEADVSLVAETAALPALPAAVQVVDRRLQARRGELAAATLAKDSYAFTLRALVAELETLRAEMPGD